MLKNVASGPLLPASSCLEPWWDITLCLKAAEDSVFTHLVEKSNSLGDGGAEVLKY